MPALLSAYERACLRAPKDPNHIPKMVHPLSKHWKQPSTDKIVIDDKFARMDVATFEALSNYSCTVPTGVYEGKMWRTNPSQMHRDNPNKWYLRWYTKSDDPAICCIETREIIIKV